MTEAQYDMLAWAINARLVVLFIAMMIWGFGLGKKKGVQDG